MQTCLSTPVGHKTLRLPELAPTLSPAYSPNLYHWMRESAHFYRDGGVAEAAYRVVANTKAAESFGAGTLLIGYPINGYPGDTDFSGSRLLAVLCQGAKAGRCCFAGIAPDLELVGGFWDRYLTAGRCAVDPEHQEHFIGGERYRIEGDARTCLWCGTTHKRVRTPRTVIDESWV